MAIEQESFNAQDLEKYINELETKFDTILNAIKTIDREIGKVVQTQDSNSGLSGEAGGRLANIWENNISTINSYEGLFQKWLTALRNVYAVNNELVHEATSVYTKEV